MGDRLYTGTIHLVETKKPVVIKEHLIVGNTNNTLASVYRATDQTGLADTVWTKVALDTEFFDVGSNFASNTYTVPITGYYLLTWGATFTTSAGGNHLVDAQSGIFVGGVATGRNGSMHNGPGIAFYISSGSCIINLTAGNAVTLYATGSTDDASTTTILGGGYTRLDVMLVSQ